MSKIIVPLHFAKLTSAPGNVATGFKKFYLRGEWFKLYNGISEIDVVLDRPLDNYVPIPGTITANDTVLTAIEKLDYAIGNINPTVLWGSITGNILLQTDLIAYIGSMSTGSLQQVVNVGNSISNFGGIGTADILSVNFTNNRSLYLNNSSSPTIKIVDNLNASHYTVIDIDTLNLDGTVYNWSSIVNPTIPTVGTWGALNYPTWVSGTPFVTMTAAGTFALDNNTYLTQESVLEFPDLISFPVTGAVNTIYIALDTDIPYYWDGVSYQVLTSSSSGITGFGTINTVPKFSPTGSELRNSRFTDDGAVGRYGNASNYVEFITGSNTFLKLDRGQSKMQFILGNPLVPQENVIYSDNTYGNALETKGYLAFRTGATATTEGLRILSTGQLELPQTPATGTTSDFVLLRDTSGNVKQISYPTGGTSPLTTKGDLYTFSTVDTRLPVGLDTQVLLADSSTATGLKWGTNTAPTPLGYYGAWQTDATQTAAVNNTGYAMKFTIADITPNGISIVNNGSGDPTRITFANTGIYNIQFSSQFQNIDNVEHDVTIWLRLNGTDIAGSSGFVQVPKRRAAGVGNEGHVIAAWNYVLSVVAGEYYEITWSTTDATHVTMQFYAAGSPPPSAASVIMTVTQQAGIMAGTGITALNSLTAAAQTFVNDTNVTVVSSGTTHTVTWAGTLADSRIASSTTWNNKLNDILLSDMTINMPTNGSITVNNVVGTALTISGTPTIRTITDTSLFTRTTRVALETTAVAANVFGFRQVVGYFSINTGFKASFKFGGSTGATNTNVRYSIGIFTANFIVTNVDPTTFINCAAFARIDGNTNWQFIHNDATGTATAIDLGSSFPANVVSTDMYYGVIETVGANIKYTLTRLNTGVTTTGTASTNLVAVSTLLSMSAGCSNNANAAICALDFGGMQLIKFT